MAMEAERIGARMRERRLELDLKQREVADRIPGNTEGKDISRWENGKHRPQGDTLEAIATALETTVEDLYGGPQAERKTQPTPDLFAPNGSQSQLDRIEEKLDRLLRVAESRIETEVEAELDQAEDPRRRRSDAANG